MKGLLLKDFYVVTKQLRLFLVFIAVFALFLQSSVATLAIFYAALLPINTVAYDERARWDNLAAMMPYTKQAMVFSKYLLGAAGVVGASLLCTLSQMTSIFVKHTAFEPYWLVSLLLTMSFALTIMSLTLPFVFAFGVEKARLILVAVIIGSGLLGVSVRDAAESVLQREGISLGLTAAGAAALVAVVGGLSVWISVKVYSRREL